MLMQPKKRAKQHHLQHSHQPTSPQALFLSPSPSPPSPPPPTNTCGVESCAPGCAARARAGFNIRGEALGARDVARPPAERAVDDTSSLASPSRTIPLLPGASFVEAAVVLLVSDLASSSEAGAVLTATSMSAPSPSFASSFSSTPSSVAANGGRATEAMLVLMLADAPAPSPVVTAAVSPSRILFLRSVDSITPSVTGRDI